MSFDPQYEYRIGFGNDLHRLVPGRKLMLGGIEVPFDKGLLAHSDGDVVIHAVIDALLGAAGMGDIGGMFPDSDEKYAGVDSKALLLLVADELDGEQWQIVNLDITIEAEEPKLSNFKGQMKRALSGMLSMDFAAVNVKAKTNEGMGPVGSGIAIAASAITLIRRRIKRHL